MNGWLVRLFGWGAVIVWTGLAWWSATWGWWAFTLGVTAVAALCIVLVCVVESIGRELECRPDPPPPPAHMAPQDKSRVGRRRRRTGSDVGRMGPRRRSRR